MINNFKQPPPMEDVEIKPKQCWQHRSYEHTVRIMAVVDGWIMFRRKGCVPDVMLAREFEKKYRLNPQIKKNGKGTNPS